MDLIFIIGLSVNYIVLKNIARSNWNWESRYLQLARTNLLQSCTQRWSNTWTDQGTPYQPPS